MNDYPVVFHRDHGVRITRCAAGEPRIAPRSGQELCQRRGRKNQAVPRAVGRDVLDIQFIVPSEHGPYHGEVTAVDRLPYAAAAHFRSVAAPSVLTAPPVRVRRLVADQIHHFQPYSVPVQQSLELFGIGVALSPTPEVPSDHDAANGDAAQQLGDELFPRKLTEAEGKVNDDQVADADAPQRTFLLTPRQDQAFAGPEQHRTGQGIERQHRGRARAVRNHALQQRSMASMEAVEHAHGEHHAVFEWSVGQSLPVGNGQPGISVMGAAPRRSRLAPRRGPAARPERTDSGTGGANGCTPCLVRMSGRPPDRERRAAPGR